MGTGTEAYLSLPKDAVLVGLWPDSLTFRTRHCLLPGTPLAFRLILEGHQLPLRVQTTACLVIEKDRQGYVYHSLISLDQLPEADRQLIGLFISKGRGSPELVR